MRVTQMSAFAPSKQKSVPSQNAVQPLVTHREPAFKKSEIGKLLSGFEKDDYILLGIIAVLIWEGCDDYILLAALGYLFFMGIK